jgi:hypothetical protein
MEGFFTGNGFPKNDNRESDTRSGRLPDAIGFDASGLNERILWGQVDPSSLFLRHRKMGTKSHRRTWKWDQHLMRNGA